jgi:GntR family transcriptional regulator, transcriptional repressor for pyruvate dehydrogenase complex
MFNQAKQTRTFENVIFQIQEAILEEKLRPGDKLPGERELGEIFGVSRGTLREAFRALEQKGLVTIKTGVKGGAFVAAVNTRQMNESLDILLRYRKISLHELAEFREVVEGVVAAKAAQKATREDLNELRLILHSIKTRLDTPEPKWDELIMEDTRFHLALAKVAGNRVFESVLDTIYDNINRYFERFLPKESKILRDIYQDLSRITAAIESRDSNKAQSLLLDHVKRFNQLMEKSEEAIIPKL